MSLCARKRFINATFNILRLFLCFACQRRKNFKLLSKKFSNHRAEGFVLKIIFRFLIQFHKSSRVLTVPFKTKREGAQGETPERNFSALRLAQRYGRSGNLERWSGKKLGKLISKSVKSALELAKDVRSVAIKIKRHSPRDSHSIKNFVLYDRKVNDYCPRVWMKIYREIPLVGEINIHQADERWARNEWTRWGHRKQVWSKWILQKKKIERAIAR